jgi:hypothetical protein
MMMMHTGITPILLICSYLLHRSLAHSAAGILNRSYYYYTQATPLSFLEISGQRIALSHDAVMRAAITTRHDEDDID